MVYGIKLFNDFATRHELLQGFLKKTINPEKCPKLVILLRFFCLRSNENDTIYFNFFQSLRGTDGNNSIIDDFMKTISSIVIKDQINYYTNITDFINEANRLLSIKRPYNLDCITNFIKIRNLSMTFSSNAVNNLNQQTQIALNKSTRNMEQIEGTLETYLNNANAAQGAFLRNDPNENGNLLITKLLKEDYGTKWFSRGITFDDYINIPNNVKIQTFEKTKNQINYNSLQPNYMTYDQKGQIIGLIQKKKYK